MDDFSDALLRLKVGRKLRRKAWKPNKYVWLRPASLDSMSYFEIVYIDGSNRRAPWTPTRCDLIENDWEQV